MGLVLGAYCQVGAQGFAARCEQVSLPSQTAAPLGNGAVWQPGADRSESTWQTDGIVIASYAKGAPGSIGEDEFCIDFHPRL